MLVTLSSTYHLITIDVIHLLFVVLLLTFCLINFHTLNSTRCVCSIQFWCASYQKLAESSNIVNPNPPHSSAGTVYISFFLIYDKRYKHFMNTLKAQTKYFKKNVCEVIQYHATRYVQTTECKQPVSVML